MSEDSVRDEVFVIGDVHGCAAELRTLLNKLPLTPESTVVFLGDYIDKGEHSFEVIETVLGLQNFCQVVSLMGNHESMFLSFLENPSSPEGGMFIYNGGGATLASYANEDGQFHIPSSHLRFLNGLKLHHEWEDYFFVHAGLPNIALERLNPVVHKDQMLWIRNRFLETDYQWSKTIVHGHSAVKRVEVKPNRINLDTGCVYGNFISAMALPSRRFYSVAKHQKERHVYLRDRSGRVAIRFEGAVPVYVYSSTAVFEFETLNFNEFGLFMRSVTHLDKQLFSKGERIKGNIGSNEHSLVRFDGQVIRVEENDGGFLYAVQMSRPLNQDEAEPWA